jgi:hypothetical protein
MSRHLCGSREPRAADQSSIFTLKSCVFHGFSVILAIIQLHEVTLRTRHLPPRLGCALSRFSSMVRSRVIRRPFSPLLFNRPNATATSESSGTYYRRHELLLSALRDRFESALGLFVGKYLINLTLRNGDQTTHDSHRTFEIQLFLARFTRLIVSWRHLITLNRSRVPLL